MFARKSRSHPRAASDSFGAKSPNTFSWVSSVCAVFRSQSYSPLQKNVRPPSTCSMSSVSTPWRRSASYSASPKSSPTGPTGRTWVKKLEASEKWVAEPPSARSRSPNGVLIASKAIDPTTVSDIAAGEASATHRISAEMRAVQIEEFGGPEVLQVVDLPKPEPADGEVLVEVSRAGINFA